MILDFASVAVSFPALVARELFQTGHVNSVAVRRNAPVKLILFGLHKHVQTDSYHFRPIRLVQEHV